MDLNLACAACATAKFSGVVKSWNPGQLDFYLHTDSRASASALEPVKNFQEQDTVLLRCEK